MKTEEKKNLKKDKKEKKDKKKKDKYALSFRRVVSNNFYALKTIHKVAPSYLPTYFLWSVGNAIFNFLTNTWLLREIVNRYELGRSASEVIGMLVVLLLADFIWDNLVMILPQIIYPRYNQKIVEKIETEMFKKAEQVELECYENPEFYDKYVKAMDNAYGKCMDVVYTTDNLIWCIVSFFATSAMLLYIDPFFAVFAVIPLIFGFIRTKRDKIQKERDDERRKLDRREGYVQRVNYLGEYAKEMRLSRMPTLMNKIYDGALKDYIVLWRKYGFKTTMMQVLANMGANFTSTAAMIYASFRTFVSKTMMIGDCLVVFNTIGSISYQIMRFVSTVNDYKQHALYLNDYRYFLEYEPKIKKHEDGEKAGAGELEIKNVSFKYFGAQSDTLKNLSFSIHKGEKIALVGHNGSGKTTLVKLLLHLYEPTSGEITLNGKNIKDYGSSSYRDAFTVVFQDFKIFSLSVAENVLLRPLKDGDDELVTEALKKSGAYDKVMTLKNGINTTLTREFDDEGAVLSVGESQKVTLARAFTNDSPFVILDEPSSALDPIAEYNMFKNMLEACENRTLIFISHRLSSAVLADRIFLMDGGEIVESGTHAELMELNGKYAEMFRMQAENYADTEISTESGVKGNEG